MGVVNTTYTFTGTDTITSSKLNNIIDQTTFTNDSIQGTTLQVVSGKLAVRAGNITSNELASNSATTAKIADSAITTAKIANSAVTTDKIANGNITQSKLANNVVGNGPAFKAYANTTTSIPDNNFAKVTFDVEVFDTNSNYDTVTSRFTPKIAGYYLITGCVSYVNLIDGALVRINKNNTPYAMGSPQGLSTYRSNVSDIVYLDGVDDFVELFAYQDSGTQNLQTGLHVTYFSGCLIRSA
jgi:hypothetical protein